MEGNAFRVVGIGNELMAGLSFEVVFLNLKQDDFIMRSKEYWTLVVAEQDYNADIYCCFKWFWFSSAIETEYENLLLKYDKMKWNTLSKCDDLYIISTETNILEVLDHK